MEFLKKNKLIVGIVATIILIGGVILFFVFGSQSAQPSQTAQKTTTPQPTYIPPSFSPSETPQDIAKGWKEGVTPQYSIRFPADWTPDVTYITGGGGNQGSATTFMPTVISGTSSFPRIKIEVSPSSTTAPLEDRIKELAPLHLTRSDVLFHGIQTVMLQDNLPFDFFLNSQKLNVFKTFLFFTYNNNAFTISYSYYTDNNATSNKQIFDTMVASFEAK
jgi:hypothetical protein